MNNLTPVSAAGGRTRTSAWPRWLGLGVTLAGLVAPFTETARCQNATDVKTIAGGPVTQDGAPNGYVDGPSLQKSQFNHPLGITIDSRGIVYMADRDNGRIRKLDVKADAATTFLQGLNRPIDVAVDALGDVYVLLETEGSVRKYNSFGNPLGTVVQGLVKPTAFALDSSTNLYVAELGGTVSRISPSGVRTVLKTGFNLPGGIEVADNGTIAVAETGGHAIQLIDPATLEVRVLVGANGQGAIDGPKEFAQLNGPRHIAKAPNGMLVVADSGNHKIRLVATNGTTTTLYGVPKANWLSNFPGWEDGSTATAESRDPGGVAVDRDGTVFVTENYWHIIRGVTGTGLSATGGGPGTGGTPAPPIQVQAPSFSPLYGYYPAGQWVKVSSPNPDVFYTKDGSAPTTNSARVEIVNNVGQIFWGESQRDLSSLQVRAFVGTNASVVVGGKQAPANEIGVVRDMNAGPGSTVVVPVVLNLVSNQLFKSLQFRFQVARVDGSGAGPVVVEQIRALSVRTNDFQPVVAPSQGADPAVFTSTAYPYPGTDSTHGLLIAFIGNNANFWVRNFSVAAMVSVRVPASAASGTRYRMTILNQSATSDGQQASAALAKMPDRDIVVTNSAAAGDGYSYLVGDSSPSGWYNAGDFGNGILENADVNNAFYAAIGVKTPFPFTDAFDSMDAFPEDTTASVGGDGEIRFLDWQIILRRSAGLNTNNVKRAWNSDGRRTPIFVTSGSPASPAVRKQSVGPLSGSVWVRQALIAAGAIEHAGAGALVRVPVTVSVASGSSLGGLLFSVSVKSVGGSPNLDSQARFVPAAGIPNGVAVTPELEVVGYGWDLGTFQPVIQGKQLLGTIEFRIPALARAGDCYVVKFLKADGSPDLSTQYDLESVRGCVWVSSQALRSSDSISDEWKSAFFGSPDDPLAGPNEDPDGDGATNAAEYTAGTHPSLAGSRLAMTARARANGVALRWLSAPGKTYSIESSTTLTAGGWTPVAADVQGTGGELEIQDLGGSAASRFYRIRVR